MKDLNEVQLYRIYDDGDGHRYLIPKCEYRHFEKALERVEESYDTHFDEEVYFAELDDILSYFSKSRFEGEEFYVVLASDLEEGI